MWQGCSAVRRNRRGLCLHRTLGATLRRSALRGSRLPIAATAVPGRRGDGGGAWFPPERVAVRLRPPFPAMPRRPAAEPGCCVCCGACCCGADELLCPLSRNRSRRPRPCPRPSPPLLRPPRPLPRPEKASGLYFGPSPTLSGRSALRISRSMNFSIWWNLPCSSSETKVMALPVAAARAVRPMRWM